MDQQVKSIIAEQDGIFYCAGCNTRSIATTSQRGWREIFEKAHMYCSQINGGEEDRNGKT